QQLLEASEQRMEATERHIETESRDLAANSRILLGACFILALLCALVTVVFARSSIRRIESQASELSRVSWQMLQSQETLARRFSHELHDELGQSLAAVKANLTAGSDAEWASRRADCIDLVDQSIANVRELSQLLHPVILDDFGLDAGLRWLSDGFSQRTGIAVEYHSIFTGRLDDQVETHLFRIAQEALTNVARHSGANLVRIDLHPLASRLQLVIEDDGQGLRERTSPAPSLGMTGMRARAQEIGGELRVTSPPQAGVRLEVEVPLKPAPQEDVEPENAHSIS
ncbi:MAG: sensor histidine kinase, partial [Bryobacteraceae bacterium]|nr:sensor histidine kinase [Bryobacteraceae bacterium]